MNTTDFSLLRRFLSADADNDDKFGYCEFNDGYSIILYRRIGTAMVLLAINNLSTEPSDGISYVDISISFVQDAPEVFPDDEEGIDLLVDSGKNILHIIESLDLYTSLQNMSAAYLILLDAVYRAMCLCQREDGSL